MDKKSFKNDLPHMSGRDCLNRVVEVCRNLPHGILLDLPAGTGALAVRLADLKFRVYCADIDRGLFKAKRLPFKVQNLNKKLGYPKHFFDIITCIAGLQRTTHPGIALKEFSRILKKDGLLIAAIPNYAILRKRLRYLFTGSIDKNIDFPTFTQTIKHPEANFRTVITIPHFITEAQLAGFQIESMLGDRFSRSAILYFPLMLLIKIFSWIRSNTKNNLIPNKYTSSLTAFGCRFVIFICRKKAT